MFLATNFMFLAMKVRLCATNVMFLATKVRFLATKDCALAIGVGALCLRGYEVGVGFFLPGLAMLFNVPGCMPVDTESRCLVGEPAFLSLKIQFSCCQI